VVRHITDDECDMLRIELLSDEAVKTSAIEGEMLDRSSVQSSLRRQFGLDAGAGYPAFRPQERGIADMMIDLYGSYADPLDHETLFRWHHMLIHNIGTIGAYRTHTDPMQIVSGRLDRPTVHYEALPSTQVLAEMEIYVGWFNDSAPNGKNPLPALTRAGMGHLYFEAIHPFEDGNGRIGRALVEKVVARLFREGISGFKGGLSAENYIAITRTSRATATRDLQSLVEQGVLVRTGERRYARYHLNLPELL